MYHILFTSVVALYIVSGVGNIIRMKKIFYSPYYELMEFGFFIIIGTVAVTQDSSNELSRRYGDM